MTTVLKIKNMSCQHCVAHVTDALSEIDGVQNVDVSLEKNIATVEHDEEVSLQSMADAVIDAGYEVE